MLTVEEIDQMSLVQKLQVMESLWESITHHEEEYLSPAWHEQVLKETETSFANGQEVAVDWKKAKQELRKLFE
ncbi:MAG: addiction module protein [Lentisphaerae bacterium]|jgi:hypothetical protein|nr:addiction module protein [Lentisphaerota bacterium]